MVDIRSVRKGASRVVDARADSSRHKRTAEMSRSRVTEICDKNTLFPPGFSNPANSCYANSTLQCLVNQELFRDACMCLAEQHKKIGQHCSLCYPVNEGIFQI